MPTPRSINLPASGTDTQSYELAPGLAQYVQAVYVEVDNTSGQNTRPLLTLSEQSGVVIAKKRQDAPIAAGTSDSATWALRLDADLSGVIRYGIENFGDWLHVFTDAVAGMIFEADNGGIILLDASGLMTLRAEDGLLVNVTGNLTEHVSGDAFQNAATWTIQTTGDMSLESRGVLVLDSSPGSNSITLRIPNGASMEVQDAAQNPIFRVNSDGSLQGKTGKTLTFNL